MSTWVFYDLIWRRGWALLGYNRLDVRDASSLRGEQGTRDMAMVFWPHCPGYGGSERNPTLGCRVLVLSKVHFPTDWEGVGRSGGGFRQPLGHINSTPENLETSVGVTYLFTVGCAGQENNEAELQGRREA